jgi:hypothetical protein
MQSSDLIYIVMPVIALLALVVLIGLPFVGDRQESHIHAHGEDAPVFGGEDTRGLTSQPADGTGSPP